MRKDLKKIIFESVSNLRNLFTKMMDMHDDSIRQTNVLENTINLLQAEPCPPQSLVAMGHAATSCDGTCELPRTSNRQVLPSH
jgi:hypothetical protein